MTFRIQGSNFSLTYPQSDFDLNALLDYLKQLTIGRAEVVEVIVCSERHEDGNLHRHAYVRFNYKVDLRKERFFDFMGKHANVQRTSNVQAWKNYVRKDGECLEWSNDATYSDNLYEWARLLTREDFFERARKAKVHFGYARNAWDAMESELNNITFFEDPNLDLNIPWPENLAVFNMEEGRTNVIVGPTGCGKTVYCCRKMLKPILFCTHVDQLKNFSQKIHRSILFDDMDFSHWPTTAQIHLTDRRMPRAINRRYGTTLIPPEIQVSVTCNTRPFTWDPAINRRLNLLTL